MVKYSSLFKLFSIYEKDEKNKKMYYKIAK